MITIDKFQSPTMSHRVQEENGGFTIAPTQDSDEALACFQAIAREAERYKGDDFIPRVHRADGVIDLVFFERVR